MPLSYIVLKELIHCAYVRVLLYFVTNKKKWIPNGNKEYNINTIDFSYISYHSINFHVNGEKSDLNRWTSYCFLKHEQISDLLDQEMKSALK